MTQTCERCSRINPPEAVYCYFDGSLLPARARNGAPVPLGVRPFPFPFVFSSGRSCRNLDELALGCHDCWSEANQLLKQGDLERFFTGLGREDLARIAREAARVPDQDWGLDQLLVRLPTTGIFQPASLQVEPREINLGQLRPGEERRIELHLVNQGLRLLHGTAAVDCAWLALGDPPGARQKVFQIRSELVLTVWVRGKLLSAINKPREGRLLIESNGGNVTVPVRCEMSVKAFPDGVLAGATSPRQLAEKARDRPKEAAPFFENGAVAEWYRANGWVYPVQGPPAVGVGAIQQFFEALGLSAPPRVFLSASAFRFEGEPGLCIRPRLEVKTKEKRPVFAHAESNQPWLIVESIQQEGRTAAICLLIPAIPDRPGEVLQAKLVVTSNGRQRFEVPVTLDVIGVRRSEEPILDALPVEDVEVVSLAPEIVREPVRRKR